MGVDVMTLRSKQGLLKLLEVIIGSVCIALYTTEPIYQNEEIKVLCIGVFIGYLIVTGGYMVGYLTGVKTRYQETIHNFAGAVLYLAIGISIIHETTNLGEGRKRDYGIAIGVCSLVNCLLYAVDTFFAYRNE